MFELVGIGLIYSAVCAVLAAWLANRKARGTLEWFFLGLAYGILALIALVALPDDSLLDYGRRPRGP